MDRTTPRRNFIKAALGLVGLSAVGVPVVKGASGRLETAPDAFNHALGLHLALTAQRFGKTPSEVLLSAPDSEIARIVLADTAMRKSE